MSSEPRDLTGGLPGPQHPTEAATLLAELARMLLPEEQAALARLLSHSLASPTRAERREARIGLLTELVSNGTGEVPAVADYETLRQQRAADGERWPAASVLVTAYGTWLAAVKAAMRLHFGGSAARVPRSYQHAMTRQAGYTRDQAIDAIRRCRRELGGEWPSQGEYDEWMRTSRWAARLAGTGDPRIPGEVQIRKLFGSWHRALEIARREHGGEDEAAA